MSTVKPARIDDFVWELPLGFVPGMRVPGRVFASDDLFAKAVEDARWSKLPTWPRCRGS
jgi:hypothetical protein